MSLLIESAVKLKKWPKDNITTVQITRERDSALRYVLIGIFLYPENIKVKLCIPNIKNLEIKIDQNGFWQKFGKKYKMRFSILFKNNLCEYFFCKHKPK